MIIIIIVVAVIVIECAFLWWAGAKIYNMARNPDEVNRSFFSICPPNKIIIPMDGANPRRYISNSRGIDIWQKTGMLYFIDEVGTPGNEFGEILLNTDGHLTKPERFKSLTGQTYSGVLDELWGIHWLGLPPMGRLYSFKSEWNEVTKNLSVPLSPNKESTKEIDFGFKAREGKIASFSIMKNYGWVARGLETGRDATLPGTVTPKLLATPNNVQIDIYIFSTIVIVNAYQAFIMTNWAEGVDAVIRRVCTQYCGKYGTNTLGENGGADLVKMLWEANIILKEKYGVIFSNIEYNGWDYSGTPEEKAQLRATNRLVWAAEHAKEAAFLATDAATNDIEKKGAATAKVTADVGKAANAVTKERLEILEAHPGIATSMINAEALERGMGAVKPGAVVSIGNPVSILAEARKVK